MLTSSITTLLVVTRDRVIRAEFRSARADAPSSLSVRERPETDDPVAAVVAALGNEKRSPGRVFVLSNDIWTRTLDLPIGNVANLSDEELRYSLAFEAEPLSGLAASEAATAALPLSTARGMQTVWMTQTSAHTLSEIDEVVRGARGKLAGVLHPGGVPASLNPASAESGDAVRVEFWSDVTVRYACAAGKPTTARIDELKGMSRPAIIEEWAKQRETSDVDVLLAEFRPAPEPDWQSWDDEAVLERWLAAWNRVLSAKQPTIPMLRPAKRPMTAQQRNSGAGLLAIVALIACAAHGYWVRTETEKAVAEQTRLEAPGKELAALNTQKTELEKGIQKLQEELKKRSDDVRGAEETLDAHRRRLGQLLERLAKGSSDEWVLQKIEGTPREIKLVGVTMHPEHVSEMASELANELNDLGWTVEPPEQTARNLQDNGGPWTFSLRLHDQTARPLSAPSATPPGTPANVVRFPVK